MYKNKWAWKNHGCPGTCGLLCYGKVIRINQLSERGFRLYKSLYKETQEFKWVNYTNGLSSSRLTAESLRAAIELISQRDPQPIIFRPWFVDEYTR